MTFYEKFMQTLTKIPQMAMDSLAVWVPKAIFATMVLIFFFFLLKVAKKLILEIQEQTELDEKSTKMTLRITRAILYIVGFICFLGVLGVDVMALIAGFSLSGVFVTLALKDTVSNAFSGLMLRFYKPFAKGDTIKAAGVEGEVFEVGVRYTVVLVKDEDGNVVRTSFIPNSKLSTNVIDYMGDVSATSINAAERKTLAANAANSETKAKDDKDENKEKGEATEDKK